MNAVVQQKPVSSSPQSSAAHYPHQLKKICLAGTGGDGWLLVCGLPLAVKIHCCFLFGWLFFRIVANRYDRGMSSVADG